MFRDILMSQSRHCRYCQNPLPVDGTAPICVRCGDIGGDETIPDSRPPETEGAATHRHDIPQPGDTFGNYRILRLLGRGGMGHVFEVVHLQSGRRLALKVMGHEFTNEEDCERFLREGRLAASVNHPNIVHIHGCEEIGGAPVIAMEFVPGGTLAERVKKDGPFTPAAATEAILQLIDGLEAAHLVGILHRDIKPSNCFIQPDGTLKIGDFGLSISTQAREEESRGAKHSTVGTPAYASPEQLRGDALDVRSDIYSVGATLYQLLTGKAPFTGPTVDAIIEAALKTPPASPALHRPELPPNLVRLVFRCLAKNPRERFATYEEFRHALLPFRGGPLTPGKPTMRFLADIVDNLVAFAPSIPFVVFSGTNPTDEFLRNRTSQAAILPLALFLWRVLYYAVAEGQFGAGFGKRLCGLRVVRADGQPPGILRGLYRASLFSTRELLPPLIVMAWYSQDQIQSGAGPSATLLGNGLWLFFLSVLFLTMRRSNGYQTLHDLASGTRVVLRPENQPRPALSTLVSRRTLRRPKSPNKPASQPAEGTSLSVESSIPDSLGLPPDRFGPYQTIEVLWDSPSDQLVAALDPILNRSIWVHRVRADLAVDDVQRRELSRPTRLRSLQAGRDSQTIWHAYEAPAGLSFLEVIQRRQPWRAVRFWIHDLISELDDSQPQPSAPTDLLPQFLWITASGRAMRLEFPAPILHPKNYSLAEKVPLGIDSFATPQLAVASLARLSLEGIPKKCPQAPAPATAVVPEIPLPLPARSFFENIAREEPASIHELLGELGALLAQDAEIPRPRRAASLMLMPGLILVMGILSWMILQVQMSRTELAWANRFPNKASLPTLWQYRETLGPQDRKPSPEVAEKQALIDIYIARNYAKFVRDGAQWSDPSLEKSLHDIDRARLLEIVESNAAQPADRIDAAERQVPIQVRSFVEIKRLIPIGISLGFILVGIPIVAVIELLGILLATSSPILQLFGIVFVTRSGTTPSRLRLTLRWLVGWGALMYSVTDLSIRLLLLVNERFNLTSKGIPIDLLGPWLVPGFASVWAPSAVIFLALATSLQNPACGWFDRLFGTRLVLRS